MTTEARAQSRYAARTIEPITDDGADPGEPITASQMPVPVTYHLLCMVPDTEDTYGGGIVKAHQTMLNEEVLSPVLFVVSMGPDAYSDKTRFPSGPSCKVGDFVLVRPNSGTRVKIHGTEIRLINDDNVEAVVSDPRGIRRA